MAPDFLATDQYGRRVHLGGLRGHWVVLYFYPKDRTMGCTAEACGFRNQLPELRAEDAIVVGVSKDDLESHSDFAQRRGLHFPLLSDPNGDLLKRYRADGFFGLAKRITYIIDPQGRIAKSYRFVNAARHAKQVLNDLRELRATVNRNAPRRTLVHA